MRIGEVAGRSGVSKRMLRHYDGLGLVSPSERTSAGYREYSEADFRRLVKVESLRSIGMSLGEIREALEGEPSVAEILAQLEAETEARLEAERALLVRVRSLMSSAPDSVESLLSYLDAVRTFEERGDSARYRAALSVPTGLALVALAQESDPNVIGALQWSIRQDASAEAVLLELLPSLSEQERGRLVELLPDVVPSEVLEAEGSRVAVFELARRGERGVVGALLDLIEQGVDDVEAAELLAGMASGEDVAEIGQRISDASSVEVKLRFVQALAEIPLIEAAELLRELTRSEDRQVALTAEAILGRASGS
ncbi:MerR family transcriptional regulator [Corynebacterium lubricantis]|uniref:MerR family transcriptional regulator n=1 Tax=Corynebacterium lubricantis TaxID=541095 RepID=UPI00036C68DE|nr:MerR family transcriptional regulator [Corynebacterium lubricantis]